MSLNIVRAKLSGSHVWVKMGGWEVGVHLDLGPPVGNNWLTHSGSQWVGFQCGVAYEMLEEKEGAPGRGACRRGEFGFSLFIEVSS
jgi:hypothetical protein